LLGIKEAAPLSHKPSSKVLKTKLFKLNVLAERGAISGMMQCDNFQFSQSLPLSSWFFLFFVGVFRPYFDILYDIIFIF